MKLKLIALAAVLAAAGSANATVIDSGTAGNGGLMFSIWDGANSYSRNLGFSINSFETGLAAAGNFTASFAADTTFTSFLGTADLAALKWNVVATDRQGAVRVLETFTAPMPLTTKPSDSVRGLASGTGVFITDVNLKLAAADSATYAVGTKGYAGGSAFGDNGAGALNFSNAGTFANSTYASGLSFMRINALATGILPSTYTPYLDGGNSVKLYLDGSNALNIAAVTAVPEPESFAMLLAGLGLMGAIARRRNKKSV